MSFDIVSLIFVRKRDDVKRSRKKLVALNIARGFDDSRLT